jgi:hypothetical protein
MIEESNKNVVFKSLLLLSSFNTLNKIPLLHFWKTHEQNVITIWVHVHEGNVIRQILSSYRATSATLITFGVTSFFFSGGKLLRLDSDNVSSYDLEEIQWISWEISGLLRYFLSGDNYVFINVILQCTFYQACPTN